MMGSCISKNLVSIVIPTYNHAHFLKRALGAIVAQTHGNWEAIVVDNHSTDNTVEVVESLGDPRIRLLQIHNNGVIAASRNLGIAESRGEWLAFLDSDDFWYPAKLQKCLAHLSRGYDLVCHGERWIGDGRDRQVIYGPTSRATYQSLLYNGNCLSTSAVVMRVKNARDVGGFLEESQVVTAEDYDFWLRLSKSGARVSFLSEVLGEYTFHAGNQTRGVIRHMDACITVLDRHFLSLKEANVLSGWRERRRRAIAYYAGGRGLQDGGQHREALKYFCRALVKWPFFLRTYVALIMNLLGKKILVS